MWQSEMRGGEVWKSEMRGGEVWQSEMREGSVAGRGRCGKVKRKGWS